MQAFKGVWRMQPGAGGDNTTLLQYAVFVRPMPWLPVGIVQGRIEREIRANLEAVRTYAEMVHTGGVRQVTEASVVEVGGKMADVTIERVGDGILVKALGDKSSSSSSNKKVQMGGSHPIADDFGVDSEEEEEETGEQGAVVAVS